VFLFQLMRLPLATLILSKFIQNLKVNRDVFSRPFLSFSTSTELVNVLTRKYGLPFRTAHRIVGALTRRLTEKSLSLIDATPEMVRAVAEDMEVSNLDVKAEDIRESVDPLRFVRAHNVRGGPSPVEVQRMIQARTGEIGISRKWLSDEKSRLREAEEKLQATTGAYVAQAGMTQSLKAVNAR
jgi:argininosuccinate lyase